MGLMPVFGEGKYGMVGMGDVGCPLYSNFASSGPFLYVE